MKLGSFKIVINNMFANFIYLIYMYKDVLALFNLQWLICHNTKSNQTVDSVDSTSAEE